MSDLDMAVTHLNASVGALLSRAQLARAFQAGSLSVLDSTPKAAAAAAFLFVELEPRMIAMCAYEAGTDLAHANELYMDLLARAMPRSLGWERAVEAQL